MLLSISRAALAVVLGAASAAVLGQPASDAEAAPTIAPPTVVEPPTAVEPQQPISIRLPALVEIDLTVLDEITSKTAVIGEPVRLALAKPVYLTNDLGIPAGAPVEGVVIHAARGGMGGKSGELLVGAKRIVLSETTKIPLRSFKLAPGRGKNNEGIAFAAGVAGGAVGAVASMFIVGGSAKIPAGMTAVAKTSAETDIPPALLAKLPALAAPAAIETPTVAQAATVQPTTVQPTTTQGN